MRRRHLVWLAPVLLLLIFPPLHIRTREAPSNPAAISAQVFATTFWEKTLPAHFSAATDTAELWRAHEQDAASASRTYGHQGGLGSRPVFFVRGSATVASVDERGVWLDVDAHLSGATVLLMGPLFGNQLRDATGLIPITQFNSFDFNSVSAELNRLAETRVQPQLRRHAVPGAHVTFVGAGEFDDASDERLLLKIVPISLAWP